MGFSATDAFTLAHDHGMTWLAGVSIAALLVALVQMRRMSRSRRALQASLQAATSQLDASRCRDPLTGLKTRPEFEAALDQATLECDRGTRTVALLCIGLDNLRPLNDAYGHRVGDAVLAEAARRMTALHPQGSAARLGGDEFALIAEAGLCAAGAKARALLQALHEPYTIEHMDLRLTASIGIAVYPDHGSRPRLLGHAALALRDVKLGGGGAHAQYDPAMGVDAREQAELLQALRQAVERGELQLYYQPKIDARSLQVTAVEALLRWQHPQRGMVSPAVFVPLAERSGLITAIGRWVIEEACAQAAAWREQGLRMRMAVNISGHQLRQEDLVPHLEATLRRHGIPAGRLTCEITETVAMEDTRVTRTAFERLRLAGLHVSIDDFGTGHSSLATLRRLPAAELKIDRAFVVDLASGERARALVHAIVQMARTLDLRVVAEGVETEAQRDALVALGCDELQGYLFARPMTAASLALWAGGEAEPGVDAAFRPSLFDPTAPAPLDP